MNACRCSGLARPSSFLAFVHDSLRRGRTTRIVSRQHSRPKRSRPQPTRRRNVQRGAGSAPSKQPTCADGAPLWVKMVALRAGLAEPLDGDRVEAGKSAVACDPDQQSGPRCAEVPFFVAPGTREHAWQCLERTCGATIARSDAEASMRVMIERVAGLHVHQETVVACVLIGKPGERPTKEVRTFRTMTRDLEALREWLLSLGVTHVGMESTGIYWKPVYAVLEGSFELIVGNARHIRNVPGRKTDVKDA